ncbi:ABC transporter ATP-binding protein [Micromonospora sp. NPDC005113]
MAAAEQSLLIRAEDVVKDFVVAAGQTVRALDGLSLRIRQGEVVSLLGPSGCGKSTFLSMLAGLSGPTSGLVDVAGEPATPRRETGLMFQRSLLFPWRNVLENVMLPAEVMDLDKKASKVRSRELLDMVGLAGWEARRPEELSGGMQQRVALARVLLPDPELLLLDEPFGALDEMTRESLDIEIEGIAHRTGKTVVLVTHSIYEAVLVSDRVLVFTGRPGRLAGEITVDFPRPRDVKLSGTPEFAQKVAQARTLLIEGSGGDGH